MQFGFESDITGIDFTLPVDSPMTAEVLKTALPTTDLKVNIGCTRWAIKEWVRNLYPTATKQSEYLSEYSKQFNAIEFGPTFYDNPGSAIIDHRYTSNVKPLSEFKFCPRVPQSISHIRRLRNCEHITNQFLETLAGFGIHLGPVLLQLAESFSPKFLTYLQLFIKEWPSHLQLFVEVRHKEWFANESNRSQLFESLQKYNVGAVISDTAGRRDAVHMQLTTPHAFVRFVGNNGGTIEKARLDEWVDRIGQWRDLGLQSLSFFMHQHDELFAPQSCHYLIQQLNDKLNLGLRLPNLKET